MQKTEDTVSGLTAKIQYLDAVGQVDQLAALLGELLDVVAGRRIVRQPQHSALSNREGEGRGRGERGGGSGFCCLVEREETPPCNT